MTPRTDGAFVWEPSTGFGQLAKHRRSSLIVDPTAEIDRDVLEDLIRTAVWAPNHRRTEPWRFCVVSGSAREEFGALVADGCQREGAAPARVDKAARKYLRTPHVLCVGGARSPDPVLDREQRDAVAAAIQTLLLAATERHIGSFWASLPCATTAELRQFCGFETDTDLVAVVYLGLASGSPQNPGRGEPHITWRP